MSIFNLIKVSTFKKYLNEDQFATDRIRSNLTHELLQHIDISSLVSMLRHHFLWSDLQYPMVTISSQIKNTLIFENMKIHDILYLKYVKYILVKHFEIFDIMSHTVSQPGGMTHIISPFDVCTTGRWLTRGTEPRVVSQ
jgi:hypothetical protein